MDFDFSDEQEQLRDAVRKWVDKAYTFDDRRRIVADGGFSPSVYQSLAELGLTGLYVQEAYGGMDMGPVEGMRYVARTFEPCMDGCGGVAGVCRRRSETRLAAAHCQW